MPGHVCVCMSMACVVRVYVYVCVRVYSASLKLLRWIRHGHAAVAIDFQMTFFEIQNPALAAVQVAYCTP